MHPSSFYDLWARYVYTPLHGPYSLSEALEGLLFYSLNEFQDVVSIGPNRTLRHELVSELSDVVNDLQDYLVYFSSKFVISSSDSPDLIQELRASHNSLTYLSICWGAIITRLAIARGIVEHNFWPHHFHPIIDNPAALQGHRRTSFVLPNASWNRSPVSAYTFISPSHMDSTSRSPYCRLESRHLPFNMQSERLQSTQSKTYPTGGNEDQSPSLRLNATPVLSGSRPSRALFDQQPSVILLKSRFPHKYENPSDKAFAPPNDNIAAQYFCGSTGVHTSETRKPGDLRYNEKAMRIDVQAVKEIEVAMEGEGVTEVPYSRSHPVQLSSVQAEDTSRLVTVPAKASSASTASWFTLLAPYNSNLASNLHQGPTTSFPRSFTNAIPQCSTSFPSERQNIQHPVLPPFHSIPTTQKRPSKRRFGPSSLSLPTTRSFEQQSPIFHSTHPPLDTFQLYQGERQLFRKSSPPIAVDNAGDSPLPSHNSHPIPPSATAHDLCQYPASPHLHPPAPSSSKHRCLSLPPSFCQPSVTPLESPFPQTCEIRSDEVFTPPNDTFAARYFRSPTPVHTSKVKEPRDLKENAKASGVDEQAAREIEATVKGAGVTEVSCSRSYPVQPTSPQAEATSGLIMEPARTSSPSTASWSTSSAPYISNPTHNLHRGSTTWFPYSFDNAIPQPSTRLFSKGRRVHHPLSSIPLHSHSATQRRWSKVRTRCVVPSPVSPPTIPSFQQPQPNFYSTYPSPDRFQLYRGDQRMPKEPTPPIVVDNMSDTSSSTGDVPSICPASSRDLCQHPASPHFAKQLESRGAL